jgi:hypothetical protein
MKNKKFNRIVCALLFVLFSGTVGAQSVITVKYYDGTSQNYSVSEEGRLYFSGDDLVISTDGSNGTNIPVTIIQRITFNSNLGTTEISAQDKILLYPNPSNSFIRISAKDPSLDVLIFSMNGQLVQKGTCKPDTDIDVSGLSAGIYFVKVNGVTVKFIKK